MLEPQSFNQYINQGNYYLSNGYELLKKGEYRKASEMFWGAVSQTIKAIAILYNVQIVSHLQIRKFIERLAKETKDLELVEVFETVEKFHVNFYDEVLDGEGITIRLESLRKILYKLETLARKRFEELTKQEEKEKN